VNRQRHSPTLGDTPTTGARGGARDRLRDAGSKELAQLAKKVGNAQVGSLLGEAVGKRDALLAFVQQRLAEVQTVQQAEQEEQVRRRKWWHQVGRREPGFGLPDPTRWRRTAQIYKRAAEALCAGDISRGAHLLDQAVAAERAAFETVPDQVELPERLVAPRALPEERPFVADGETCPARQAPEILQQADAIVRVSDRMAEMPVPETRRTHRWWEAPEDEALDKKDPKKEAGDAAAVARTEGTAEAREPARRPDTARAPERVEAPEAERIPAQGPVPEQAPPPRKRGKTSE
jgi:hypothetical protein